MKRTYWLCLALLSIFILDFSESKASHIFGGEIHHECINTCTTRVSLRTYRDCSGAAVVNTNISWVVDTTVCGEPVPIGNWSPILVTELTPVCPSVQTQCQSTSGTINGIEEYLWTRDYDLCVAGSCNDYTVVYYSCCMNGGITSLANASTMSFYISNTFTNPGSISCNSAPIFNYPPRFYFGDGYAHHLNLSATDPDGDSLAYSLIPIKNGVNSTVTYNSGFSPQAPLGPDWQFNFDTISGNLDILPNPGGFQVGMLGLRVEEYRGGQLIGQYSRNLQMFIVAVPGSSPFVINPPTNISGGLGNGWEISQCAAGPICFDLTFSGNPTSVKEFSWDGGLPGATFSSIANPSITDTITGTNPEAQFCWTPPGPGVYHLNIHARDNTCPIYLEESRVVTIRVGAQGTYASASPNCLAVDFSGGFCGGTGNYTYQWSGPGGLTTNPNASDSVLTHIYPGPGTYPYTFIISDGLGFNDTISDSVTITAPVPTASSFVLPAGTTSVCANQPVLIDAGSGGITYLWSTGATTQTITATPPATIWVEKTLPTGCILVDTVHLAVSPPIALPLIQSSGTLNPCLIGNSVSMWVGPGYTSYLWSNASSTDTITVTTPGTYSVNITNANGCIFTDSISLSNATTPSISGTITTSTGGALANQRVYLVVHDTTNQSLTAVDTTFTNGSGYYEFCWTADTLVFVKAAPDSATYPNQMPTYADTAVFFNNAVQFDLLTAPITANFSTRFGSNPGGTGFIGGLIAAGANKNGADPVPGQSLLLWDVNNAHPVDFTETDVNGEFYFGNLAFGTYAVIADKPGVSTDLDSVPIFTLSAAAPGQDSLFFLLHSNWLQLSELTRDGFAGNSGFKWEIYPNPASDYLQLNYRLPEAGALKISLLDLEGRTLLEIPEKIFSRGENRLRIDLKALRLPPAVYLLRTESRERQWLKKLMIVRN